MSTGGTRTERLTIARHGVPGNVVELEGQRAGSNRGGPRVTVRTLDPTRLADGTNLISPSMPAGHKAAIVSTVHEGDESMVTVEITGGLGRALIPKPGTVPTLGQRIAYLPDPGWRPTPVFPEPDQTPWTHSTDADMADSDSAASDEAAVEEWGDDN